MATATKNTPEVTVQLRYDAYLDHGTGFTTEEQTAWLFDARMAIRRQIGLADGLPACVAASWDETPRTQYDAGHDTVMLRISERAARGYDGTAAQRTAARKWLRSAAAKEWVRAAVAAACGRESVYVRLH